MGLLSTIFSKAVPILSKVGGGMIFTAQDFAKAPSIIPKAKSLASSAVSAVEKLLPYAKTTKGKLAIGTTAAAVYSPQIRQSVMETLKKEPLAPLALTPLAPVVYGKQTGKAYEIATDPTLTLGQKVAKVLDSAIGPVAVGAAGALLAAPAATAAIGAIIPNKALDKSPAQLPAAVTMSPPLSSVPIAGQIPTQDSKIYKEVQPSIRITNRPNIMVNTKINARFKNKNGTYYRHSRVVNRC